MHSYLSKTLVVSRGFFVFVALWSTVCVTSITPAWAHFFKVIFERGRMKQLQAHQMSFSDAAVPSKSTIFRVIIHKRHSQQNFYGCVDKV
jgi:hypothetical protein